MMAWQSQLRDGLCDLPWWLSCARYGMVRGCGLLDCMRGTIHRRQQPDGARKRRFFWHFAAPWQAICFSYCLACCSGQIPTLGYLSIW